MYEVIFYEDINGKSELYDELMNLARLSRTNKDARIQLKQITYCIDLLKTMALSYLKKFQNILKMIFTNLGRVKIESSISILEIMSMYYFICSRKKHKKLQKVRSKKQNESAMIM